MEAHTIASLSRRFEIAVEVALVDPKKTKKILQKSIITIDKLGGAFMNQNGEKTDAGEPLRQEVRQAASRHIIVRGRQIMRTEETEERLFIQTVPSSALFASRESFITDWADS
jgi:hypothetical protein